MDGLMNLAKKGVEQYESHQAKKTGGEEYNQPHGGNGGNTSGPNFNHDEVVSHASSHAGGSGDTSLFTTAMGFLNQNSNKHDEPIDEKHVVESHEAVYERGNTSGMSASAMGSAAAMQILKQFTSGGSKDSKQGGQSQTQLISMAMAEASKLFDKHGGAASGNKQDAVNGAGMTIMKLLVQSKMSSSTGGKDSGGLGNLMGLASKFMK